MKAIEVRWVDKSDEVQSYSLVAAGETVGAVWECFSLGRRCFATTISLCAKHGTLGDAKRAVEQALGVVTVNEESEVEQ